MLCLSRGPVSVAWSRHTPLGVRYNTASCSSSAAQVSANQGKRLISVFPVRLHHCHYRLPAGSMLMGLVTAEYKLSPTLLIAGCLTTCKNVQQRGHLCPM